MTRPRATTPATLVADLDAALASLDSADLHAPTIRAALVAARRALARLVPVAPANAPDLPAKTDPETLELLPDEGER